MEILCLRAKSDISFKTIMCDKSALTQFILDCTSHNLKSRISEEDETCPLIFDLTRDLCYTIGTSVRRSSGRRSGVAVRAVDCWQ